MIWAFARDYPLPAEGQNVGQIPTVEHHQYLDSPHNLSIFLDEGTNNQIESSAKINQDQRKHEKENILMAFSYPRH